MDMIWRGVVIGVGATVVMDLWALFLALVAGEPKANWAPVGRWFYHAGRGRLFHESISDAAPFANENALGWIGHYAVGIVYGVALAVMAGPDWLAAPTLQPALLWGVVTVAAGWFLLQPGLGLGVAASKLPNPNRVRALNLAAHVAFGLGLYGTALLIR
jgi:hypothetical protein